MIPEKMAEHVQLAKSTEALLNMRGCIVTSYRQFRVRPMLEVCCPPPELLERATGIVERCDTGTRYVWSAAFNGCQIIWR